MKIMRNESLKEKKSDTINHNTRIKRYKKLVLAFGVITIALIVLSPLYSSLPARKVLNTDTGIHTTASNDITRIEKPEFFGRDNKNQPYTVKAREGVEKQAALMELYDVWADLKMQDDTYMQLTSDKADIYRDESRMNLQGSVNILMHNGYIMSTDVAQVFFKEKSIIGTTPVECKGATGQINAPAFQVIHNMDEIIFHGGRVHTILYRASDNEKSKQSE